MLDTRCAFLDAGVSAQGLLDSDAREKEKLEIIFHYTTYPLILLAFGLIKL